MADKEERPDDCWYEPLSVEDIDEKFDMNIKDGLTPEQTLKATENELIICERHILRVKHMLDDYVYRTRAGLRQSEIQRLNLREQVKRFRTRVAETKENGDG